MKYLYVTGTPGPQGSSVVVVGRHVRHAEAKLAEHLGGGQLIALALVTGPFGGRDPKVGEELRIYTESHTDYAVRPHT